ncbi:sporulation integral membrane protein YtvI [Pullulanibacillus pueri]|uniref:Permease n=1 Tax=Pullulanibacillus pueri TaxID=1437324 RepID=A0A8J2ZYL0_9BACL|nr:sporulation integral membrane protein YtvI [Pullulanibacillus pueri]MBM7683475.1 sporulation integral membrane protein YtvI [Pullulanibacillus pueri]GGH86757.1 permease [Pullulanibacillus pueri]
MNSKYLNDLVRYVFIIFRFAFILLVFTFFAVLFFYVVKYAYPFIIAFVLALLINPIVDYLETRTPLPRSLASLLAILSFMSLILGAIVFLVIEMINGLNDLSHTIPSHIKWLSHHLQASFSSHILPLWERITHIISTLNEGQQKTIEANIQELGQKLASALGDVGQSIVTVLTHFVVSFPSFLTVLSFVLMATFFISKDWYKIHRYIHKKIPTTFLDNVVSIGLDLRKALRGYVKAQMTLMVITGVTIFIGLILLRVDHALTIAIVAMLVDILPYLGTGTLLIPWGVSTFLTGNYFLTIGIGSLYAITVLQRQMIEPKILSTSIGSNPLLTLISLFVGFKLMGIMGIVLGPVCLITLTTIAHSGIILTVWHYILGKGSPH